VTLRPIDPNITMTAFEPGASVNPDVGRLEKLGSISVTGADAEPESKKSVSLVPVSEGLGKATGGTTLPEASSSAKDVGNPGRWQGVDAMLVSVIPSMICDMAGRFVQIWPLTWKAPQEEVGVIAGVGLGEGLGMAVPQASPKVAASRLTVSTTTIFRPCTWRCLPGVPPLPRHRSRRSHVLFGYGW
jgi:hypothetical protein